MPSYCFGIAFTAARSIVTPNLVNDIDRTLVASIAGPEVIDPGPDTVREKAVEPHGSSQTI